MITKEVIQHSNHGDFDISQGNLIMKGGGHGQNNIRFLRKMKIDYKTNLEYNNGVRLGNVSIHKKEQNRTKNRQAWFPKSWTSEDIKKAARYVLSLKKNQNKPYGTSLVGTMNKVKVGVVVRDGYVTTIHPIYKQKSIVKYDIRKKWELEEFLWIIMIINK